MERKSPKSRRRKNISDATKGDEEALKLAEGAQNALDPFLIPLDQLKEDPYLGDEPAEEYLQRQR